MGESERAFGMSGTSKSKETDLSENDHILWTTFCECSTNLDVSRTYFGADKSNVNDKSSRTIVNP